MASELIIDEEDLAYGLEIIQQISAFRPYSSYSFQLSPKGFSAVSEVRELVEWGMGKNMHKMKEAALEILDSVLAYSPEERVNMNLTEYECKSIEAVAGLIERSLDKQKDGVLRK